MTPEPLHELKWPIVDDLYFEVDEGIESWSGHITLRIEGPEPAQDAEPSRLKIELRAPITAIASCAEAAVGLIEAARGVFADESDTPLGLVSITYEPLGDVADARILTQVLLNRYKSLTGN